MCSVPAEPKELAENRHLCDAHPGLRTGPSDPSLLRGGNLLVFHEKDSLPLLQSFYR